MLTLLIAAALAGPTAGATADQDTASRVTVMNPREPGRGAPSPTTTMVVEPVAALIASFDADGDGRTTRVELDGGVARTFAAIEPKPGATIGYLGYGDWALRWLGDRNALPSPFEVDANGDDRIGLAELQAALTAAFDRLDKDHDGAVTRAETLTIRSGADRGAEGGNRGKRPPR